MEVGMPEVPCAKACGLCQSMCQSMRARRGAPMRGVFAQRAARRASARLVLPFAHGEHVFLAELRRALGEATSFHVDSRELHDLHWLPGVYDPNGRNYRLRTFRTHRQDGLERRHLVVPPVRHVFSRHSYARFALASTAAEGAVGERPSCEHRVSTSTVRGETFEERGRSGGVCVGRGNRVANVTAPTVAGSPTLCADGQFFDFATSQSPSVRHAECSIFYRG